MIQKRLQNIEFLRCFAVLSLVALHSLCVYVGWKNYLPDIYEAIGETSLTKFYIIITAKVLMPDANMPLFTVISGFVYAHLRKLGKYSDTKEFLIKKVKRLMIPYFIIGTIVVFTIVDWSPISILFGKAHHLWYCAMLFWCFVYIRLYERIPSWFKFLAVLFCVGTQFVFPPFDLLGLIKGIKYFPYFLLGIYLIDFLPKLQTVGGRIMIVLAWGVCILASIYCNWIFFDILLNYLFVLMLFAVVPINVKIGRRIIMISALSFGIYVFHEWFLWNIAHIYAIHPFIIEHQILYPLIAYITILGISIILTKYALKTKVGRFLLAS